MFLITSYGAPLAQKASYLALHSSLFGPVVQLIMIILSLTALTVCLRSFLFGAAQFSLLASGAVNYDYIVTNSINCLLIGSRCIPNGTHTKHC